MPTPTRVLVVEDDAAVRGTVGLSLEQQGFEVRAEPDSLGIEQAVRDFRPDLAVLDVRLPIGAASVWRGPSRC